MIHINPSEAVPELVHDRLASIPSLAPLIGAFLLDGQLELDNGAVERALRGIAVGRHNWLFAGSDAGAQRAAILYTVITSAKLHGLEPYAYLRDVLTSSAPDGRIVGSPN